MRARRRRKPTFTFVTEFCTLLIRHADAGNTYEITGVPCLASMLDREILAHRASTGLGLNHEAAYQLLWGDVPRGYADAVATTEAVAAP